MNKMKGSYQQSNNPNTNNAMMISPQSYRQHLGYSNPADQHHQQHQHSPSGGNMVTPYEQRLSLEQQLMTARRVRQEGSGGSSRSNAHGYITPAERAEVTMAVFGILRDNLPPTLESSTTQEDLLLVAKSIESKLYQTAPSPRAYSAYSTLEFRITALATAVLIHSDKDDNNVGSSSSSGGVSDTCARLSAAARKSLVYCVMVLVSYEMKNLNKKMNTRGGGGNAGDSMASNSMMMNRQSYGSSPGGNTNNNSYSRDYYHQSSVKQSPGSYSRSDSNSLKMAMDESKQVQKSPPAA